MLVLVSLLGGALRFSEMSSLIGGVSDKMLSQTLKTLTTDGFVIRDVETNGPVRVAYELTPAGRGAAERLAEPVSWLEANVTEFAPD